MLDQRGQLLRAAVGFAGCSMPSYDRALHALRFWLDSWAGIGHVTVGMARQGYDLQLTRYDEKGWRATFYTTGMEHSPTSATGTAWERTPWRAVQGAAWDALRRSPDSPGGIHEPRITLARVGMRTSDLDASHKALSPTRRARNKNNTILISSVFTRNTSFYSLVRHAQGKSNSVRSPMALAGVTRTNAMIDG